MADVNKILEDLSNSVINGDEEAAKKAAMEALEAGLDPIKAINEGLSKGMEVVGDRFSRSEIYLPEVMIAADAIKASLAILKPKIMESRRSEVNRGKVVIGTVFGDIHDIGKNLVATMLSVSGFEVHDLGCDVAVQKFIEKAEEVNADIIAMSSLLTPSKIYQKDVIKYLEDKGTRGKYYIIVGGGPITPDWVKEIGADGWGKYSEDAVTLCKRLVEEKPSKPLAEPVLVGE